MTKARNIAEFADDLSVSNGEVSIADLKPSQSMMFRNKIINGDMRIDQRNAGNSSTVNGAYTIDRWSFGTGIADKMTWGQNYNSINPPVGFTNYFGMKTTTAYTVGASEFFLFSQKIEGYNVADLKWGTSSAKTITMSFWVNSSLTGTFGLVLSNSAQDRSYPITYTISLANTWEYKTITIPGETTGTWNTNNGTGLQFYFGLGVGTNFNGATNNWNTTLHLGATGATSVVGTQDATWNITGVQLEEGSVATPFEHRPYGVELSLCQRYYEKSFSINTAPANNTGEFTVIYTQIQTGYGMKVPVMFKTRKRAAGASTIIYNPYNTTANRAAWAAGSNDAFTNTDASAITEIGFVVTNYSFPVATPDGTGNPITFNWSAESEL